MLGDGIVSLGVPRPRPCRAGTRTRRRRSCARSAPGRRPASPAARSRTRPPRSRNLHVDALALDLGDAAELVDEVHVPRRAPELAVGGAAADRRRAASPRPRGSTSSSTARRSSRRDPALGVLGACPHQAAAAAAGCRRGRRGTAGACAGSWLLLIASRPIVAVRRVSWRHDEPPAAAPRPGRRRADRGGACELRRRRDSARAGRSPRASSATCTRSSRGRADRGRVVRRASTSSPAPAISPPTPGRSSCSCPTCSASRCS